MAINLGVQTLLLFIENLKRCNLAKIMMIIHNMSIFTLCIVRIGTLFVSRIEMVTLSINLKLYQGFLKNVATTGVATQIDTLIYNGDLTLGKAAVAIDGVIEGAYSRYDPILNVG